LPYKVKVDIPTAGEQDVYIHGLGTFANGSENEVDDEQAMRYRAMNAVQKQEHTADGGLTVENVLASEIDQLEIPGVTITKVDEEKKDDPSLDPATEEQMKVDQEQASETLAPETPAVPEGTVPAGEPVVIEPAEQPAGGM
jgi:hypothetical protein